MVSLSWSTHSRWLQVWKSCFTWSWWSKNVLIHALEPASQTFTLLSDELGEAENRSILTLFISSALVALKFYLETKWVSSGEKATFRTQDPCPLSVPAKLACCLSKEIIRANYWIASLLFYAHINARLCWKTQVLLFRRRQSRGFRLNSHVIYFDVTVVWGCDQQLRVRGECEGSDGHGVTCTEGNQSGASSLFLQSLNSLLFEKLTYYFKLAVCYKTLLRGQRFYQEWTCHQRNNQN